MRRSTSCRAASFRLLCSHPRRSRADGSRSTAGRGSITRDFGVTLNEKFLN
ncbi:MAG: hypothetical protein UC451_09165 [Faecalibacterium sp.]|nr:hypothetical protein [Faecalibacterium sp.]